MNEAKSYFILTNDNELKIKRFHLFTWDLEKSGIEIGIEFLTKKQTVSFKLSLPFEYTESPKCLMRNLIDNDDNSKFIFNETIKKHEDIEQDKRNGAILYLKNRTVAILPISFKKDDCNDKRIISFDVVNTNKNEINYVRMFINTSIKDFSVIKKGITKETYIYDIKINTERNIPDFVYNLTKDNFYLCKITTAFCFHAIPILYNIAYLNSNSLRNIRTLEAKPFNDYLNFLNLKVRVNEYIIVFNKISGSDNYAFFSIFEKELISNIQICWSIVVNIICSILFAIASYRLSKNSELIFYKMPEYLIAIVIIIILLVYIKYGRKIKNFFNKKQ